MTRPKETRIQSELDSSGRKLHKQAQVIEEQWRTAHGIDDKLRSKRQQKARHKRQQRLERGEARRREERSHHRIDHSLMRQPVLVTGGGDDGPRLIKQVQRSHGKCSTEHFSRDEAGPVYYSHPYNISRCPENRKEPKSGAIFCFVTIQEIRHPAIKSGRMIHLDDESRHPTPRH
jgi:hypothetical protein